MDRHRDGPPPRLPFLSRLCSGQDCRLPSHRPASAILTAGIGNPSGRKSKQERCQVSQDPESHGGKAPETRRWLQRPLLLLQQRARAPSARLCFVVRSLAAAESPAQVLCKAVTWRRRICLQATARPLSRLLRCLPSPPLPLSWGRSHPPVRRTERTAVRSSPFVGLFPTGISGAPALFPLLFLLSKRSGFQALLGGLFGKAGILPERRLA